MTLRPRASIAYPFPLLAAALATSILCLATPPARAQWSSSASTNTQLSSFTSNSGIPTAYPDQAGGAVFAWSDARGAMVQRLDAFGIKKWGASGMQISQTNQLFAMTTSISDDAGGVISGWSETASGHSGYFVQHVDRTGTALWGAGGINLTATGAVSRMCSDGAGGVIVVWSQTSGSLVQLWMNRVTYSGTVSWGASGKLIYSSGDLKTPDFLVPSTSNGAILGWHNFLSVDLVDPDTLFFTRVDGSGNTQWGGPGTPYLRVVTLDNTSILLSCAGNSGAAYFVTQRADSAYLNLLQPAGTFTSTGAGWPIAGPTTAKVKLGQANSMIPDGTGGVVVAWRDESYGGAVLGRIRAQRLNSSGQRQWPTPGGTFVQVCPSSNDENFPSILRDAYGNFLFGWEDYRNNVSINLWAEKLDGTTGAQLWAPAGTFFASAADNQFAPRFVNANPGNAIAAFDDARTGQERLYAQFVGPLGALTPVNTLPFTTVTASPVGRGAGGYASVGSALFVEGGGGVGNATTNSLMSYTPGTDTWATLGTGYVARWFGSLAYVPETNMLYSLNGNDNISAYHSTVEEIALTGGAATLKATNPVPREGPFVAVANGRIYVIGGNNDVLLGGLTGINRYFDPVANTWSANLAALPVARAGGTAVTYNGQIYVIGGQTAGGVSSKRVDRYDIAANTWSAPLTDAPLPIAWQASAVTGGLIWCAGDLTNGWTLMSYAPATDTWTTYTTDMVGRRFAQLGAIGNTLVVSGGALGSPAQNVLDTQKSDVSALVAATPLATVTLPVSALQLDSGDLVFAAPGESTLVTLNFASVAGAGTATVARYPGPAANVSFSSGAPTTVGTTRWVMSQSGLSPFSATVSIQLYGLPDALGAWSGISIYQRATAGTGAFAPVPTSYDPATGRVSAVVSDLGEFILGSGGNVDVPAGGTAPIALAIRALGANPVRGPLAFQLSLPSAGSARLDLFDVQGRSVASRSVMLGAGVHTVGLGEGRSLASGMYFARVTQGERTATTRVVVAE